MASDQQMALTKTHRGGSSHLNRTARQVVPAFLQKLYEMVSDPSNSHLIRWSESGDSFFVMDHERFAREVLGRWFKHQNFSSFVRQLNMYGFHKIPHLQQGVLKSDTDTEYWNFEHPNFHRGQPDMLCLIQRKKQAAQSTEDSAIDIRDVHLPAAPSTIPHVSAGQLLDINSIVNGIAAIKRHQSAISADLNELKNSNELLWQETLASREKYKKQQDTINRILKFLAGVFGNAPNSMHKTTPVDHSARGMVPLKPHRLMIEQAPGHPAKGVSIIEVEDEEMSAIPSHSPVAEKQTNPPLDTPPTFPFVGSPPPNLIEKPSTPATTLAAPTPLKETLVDQTDFTPSTTDFHRSPTPTALTTVSGQPNPEAVQAAFQDMLNSPGQMQRLLAALSSQSAFPTSDLHPPGNQTTSQLTSYDPFHDLSRVFHDDRPDHTLNDNTSRFSAMDIAKPFDPTSPADPLLQGTLRLEKTHKDTLEIDNHVDALSTSINSLIESLGLDPALLHSGPPPSSLDVGTDPVVETTPIGSTLTGSTPDDSIAPEFDFHAFLNEFSGGAADYGDQVDSTAFLDEIKSVSDVATPAPSLPADSPSIPRSPAAIPARKRKSDVIALDPENIRTTPYHPKRKK